MHKLIVIDLTVMDNNTVYEQNQYYWRQQLSF